MLAVPSDILHEINKIRYFPVTVINAKYEKDVMDNGITSMVFNENYHLSHCSVPEYSKKNQIRYSISGRKRRTTYDMDDKQLIELAEKELSTLFPITSKRLYYHVKKHEKGMCAYCPNFTRAREKLLKYNISCFFWDGITLLSIVG